MSALYLYDDAQARTFEPFASTRPLSEMRSGAVLIRDRWVSLLQPDAVHFISTPRHQDFDEGPEISPATGRIPAGSIIANARCVPKIPLDISDAARKAAPCNLWQCGNRLAAVRLREPVDIAKFADGSLTVEALSVGTGALGQVDGWWLDEVWDLIKHLPEQLLADIAAFAGQSYAPKTSLPDHATVIGAHPVIVLGDSVIEPHVVFDASAGPILVNTGSHVRSFTRFTGPVYVGRDVQVMGGDINVCSIGDVCKVRGELSNTIFVGYANKGHDGFVGHSVLGRWVNLGAGTITSNLKNTYGPVALWTPGGERDTGMQFLGTLFGDHVKTGIGLRLTTGCVLGAGANVFDRMPPKAVPPFSWGGGAPYDVYRADKFIETAARMMSRRHMEMSERSKRHLASVHKERWTLPDETTEL